LKHAVKEFDVIRRAIVTRSLKDMSIIFKDLEGRIMFIDKKHPEGYDDVVEGETVYVWVTKHLERISFVKLLIDDKPIQEYMVDINSKYSPDYMTANPKVKDKIMLSNYLKNHSADYNNFAKIIQDGNANMVMPQELATAVARFKHDNITSEEDIARQDFLYLDGYLLMLYKYNLGYA